MESPGGVPSSTLSKDSKKGGYSELLFDALAQTTLNGRGRVPSHPLEPQYTGIKPWGDQYAHT